jgi:hypothetical protein
MHGQFPLATLAQFGEALGLLVRAQDERLDPEPNAVAPSVEDGNGLVRSVSRPGGKVRHLACWREGGRVRVADLSSRELAHEAISASGRGAEAGPVRARTLEIHNIRITPLAPEDAARAVSLLSGLVKPNALERTIAPSQIEDAADKPDLDAAA